MAGFVNSMSFAVPIQKAALRPQEHASHPYLRRSDGGSISNICILLVPSTENGDRYAIPERDGKEARICCNSSELAAPASRVANSPPRVSTGSVEQVPAKAR
jgi:hypothetical protein